MKNSKWNLMQIFKLIAPLIVKVVSFIQVIYIKKITSESNWPFSPKRFPKLNGSNPRFLRSADLFRNILNINKILILTEKTNTQYAKLIFARENPTKNLCHIWAQHIFSLYTNLLPFFMISSYFAILFWEIFVHKKIVSFNLLMFSNNFCLSLISNIFASVIFDLLFSILKFL